MDNNKNKEWHLTNGFCFLAIEMKSPGEWSRHYDLSTCLAKMQSKPTIITLWYTHKTSECSWSGGVDYDEKFGKPINLGCYRIGGRGANFSIKKIQSIKEKIDINSTEKGLSNSILDKFLAKYVRNIFYKSLTIKKISRYLRRKLLGDKYRITFSINSTNGSYSEAPHIDIRNKIIVGLVYLDDVSTNNSSNITFWQSKVSKLKYDKNLYIKDGNLIKIEDIFPKRNRLVIFKNDEYAIHSAKGNLSGERRFIYFSVVASRDL